MLRIAIIAGVLHSGGKRNLINGVLSPYGSYKSAI